MNPFSDALLTTLARQHGTPLWVYDATTIRQRIAELRAFDTVRYVLGDKSEQIFASRYQFALPSEDDLRAEIRREMEQFQPLELREPLEPLAPSKPLEQREGTSAKVQRAATGKPKTPATKTTKSRSKSTAAKGTEK